MLLAIISIVCSLKIVPIPDGVPAKNNNTFTQINLIVFLFFNFTSSNKNTLSKDSQMFLMALLKAREFPYLNLILLPLFNLKLSFTYFETISYQLCLTNAHTTCRPDGFLPT